MFSVHNYTYVFRTQLYGFRTQLYVFGTQLYGFHTQLYGFRTQLYGFRTQHIPTLFSVQSYMYETMIETMFVS